MNSENAAAPRHSRRGKQQPNKDKVKVSTAIKPEAFETKKGVRCLYERTKQLKLDDFAEINIENTMKKVVTVLKTWQNDFVPKYSFDYFLQRCQALGNHKRVTAYMAKVRKIHKGDDQWQQPENHAEGEMPAASEVHDRFQEDINILNGVKVNPNVEPVEDEDDEDLFALMDRAERAAEGKREERMDEEEEPYVPEGYDHVFSQED